MTTEAKAPISPVEFNVRLWKTENGWKVTTTEIDGKSRDVTSKLRPALHQAANIAMQFFHEAIAQEERLTFRQVGDVVAEMELPLDSVEVTNTDLGDVVPDESDTTPEETVEKINASMLANDRKRGFKG